MYMIWTICVLDNNNYCNSTMLQTQKSLLESLQLSMYILDTPPEGLTVEYVHT